METLSTNELKLIAVWFSSGIISGLIIWFKEKVFNTLGDLVILLLVCALGGLFVAGILILDFLLNIKLPKSKLLSNILLSNMHQKWNSLWNYKLKKLD